MFEARRLIAALSLCAAALTAIIVFAVSPVVALVFGLVLFALLLILTSERRQATLMAAIAQVLVAVFIPTYSTPGPIRTGVLLMATGFSIAALLRRKETKPRPWPLGLVALVIYLIYGILSSLLFSQMTTLLNSALMATWALAAVLVFRELETESAKVLLRVCSLILVTAVALALFEMFASVVPPWGGFLGSSQDVSTRDNNLTSALPGRSVSFFAHPIPFALFCAVVAYFNYSSSHAPRSIITRLTLLAVALIGIFLSGSRSPLIALVAAVSVVYIYRHGASNAKRLGSALLGTAALFGFVRYYLIPELDSSAGTLSFEHRFAILTSLRDIMGRPPLENVLGSGPGSSRELFAAGILSSGGFTVIDNQFILAFVSFGFVGLSLLATFLWGSFRNGDHLAKGLVIFIFIMMFSFDTSTWGLSLLLMVACAGLVSPPRGPVCDGSHPDSRDIKV